MPKVRPRRRDHLDRRPQLHGNGPDWHQHLLLQPLRQDDRLQVNQQKRPAFSQSTTMVGIMWELATWDLRTTFAHAKHPQPSASQRKRLAASWISTRHSTLPRGRIAADLESLDQSVLIDRHKFRRSLWQFPLRRMFPSCNTAHDIFATGT